MIRKIPALNEVWHKLIGSINTPEKFEAKRLEQAMHVWDTTNAADSRHCHSFEATNVDVQRARSKKKMEPVAHGTDLSGGSTCIDGYKGIAHKLPKVERDD